MQTKIVSLGLGKSVCLADIGRITLSSVRERATFLLERVCDDTLCLSEGDEVSIKVTKRTSLGVDLEIRVPDYYQINE